MKTEGIYEVVTNLIGSIDPVGESHTDSKRYENLEKMIELADLLIADIHGVTGNHSRHEFSMNKSGSRARGFIEHIRRDYE